jgi:hypothetical protein
MVPAGMLLGAAALAVGLILPHSAPRAAMPTDGVSLFTPGLGCGPTETQVGTVGLLARVRAEAAPVERRRGARPASRPSILPLRAKKAPVQVEQEPRAAILRSFYTCDAPRSPNLTEGTGWRLVGPLRQS